MFHKNPCVLYTIGGMSAGGKERQILGLLKGLRRNNNYQTAIAVFNPGGVLETDTLELADYFLSIGNRAKWNICKPLLDLIIQAKEIRVQLIHTWGSGVWDLIGLIAGRCLKIPVIHGGIRSAPRVMQLSDRISRWSALHSDAIIANSKAGLDAYNLQWHQRSMVIYNGIDLERFVGIYPNALDCSTICMVANFSNNKDHRTAIQAFSIVKNVFPDITLTLVGHDYGTLAANLQLVAELGLEQCVKFHTNVIDPGPYIAGSDICILTTFSEGLPNVVLEYMALSKPVIVTNDKGCAEAIDPQKTGFLVQISSPEATAKCIIELLLKPELARKMGIAGRDLVVEKFSINKMISAYEELYAQLLC